MDTETNTGPVVQLEERSDSNAQVVGSSPAGAAKTVDYRDRKNWPRSTMLNRENREAWIRLVLEDLVPKAPDEDKFLEGWGDKLYAELYDPYLDHLKALPAFMQYASNELYVKVEGRPGTIRLHLSSPKLKSYQNQYVNSQIPVLPVNHAFSQGYTAIHRQIEDCRTKQNETRKQLSLLISDCRTSHQLFKAWPQAVKYAEALPYVERQKTKIPTQRGEAVEIATKLNKLNIT